MWALAGRAFRILGSNSRFYPINLFEKEKTKLRGYLLQFFCSSSTDLYKESISQRPLCFFTFLLSPHWDLKGKSFKQLEELICFLPFAWYLPSSDLTNIASLPILAILSFCLSLSLANVLTGVPCGHNWGRASAIIRC